MGFKLGLVQSGYPADGDVLSQARSSIDRARQAGCGMLVFPENFMWPRKLSAAELRDLAEPVDGPFVQSIAAAAREAGLWIVFTMNERNSAGSQPFNTAVVMDKLGEVRGTYRKCHLYDALGVRESDRLTAGDALFTPIRTPFCTLGVGICYDLRFPELARAAALAGCQLLVYPAAWHAGPSKREQWDVLLRARAIENEMFVAGCDRAGKGFTGCSLVADPMGRVLAQSDDDMPGFGVETIVTCDIDVDALAITRNRMPLLEHRRPELYRA